MELLSLLERRNNMEFYTLGSVLAVTISFTGNRSISKAIAHGLLSWGYVVYCLIFTNDK